MRHQRINERFKMTDKQKALEAFDIYQTMSFPDLDNCLKTFAALVAPHTETIRAALTDPEIKEGDVREAVDTVKQAKSILHEILKDKPAHIVDEVRKNGVGKFVIYELIDRGFIKAAQCQQTEVVTVQQACSVMTTGEIEWHMRELPNGLIIKGDEK